MKYIKLFEDLKSKGYEKITSDYYRDATPDSLDEYETFNQAERDALSKIGAISLHSFSLFTSSPHINKEFELIIDDKVILFCKLQDEWYYLHVYSTDFNEPGTFFRCDQFDGLLNCLSHTSLKEFNI